MIEIIVSIHSALRWVVLAAGAVALVVALAGWLGTGPSDRTGRQTMLLYIAGLDVQVLLGILIWLLGNWWQSDIRQFKFEHPIVMILALVVAHVAAARARRTGSPSGAARTRALGAAISLALILAGIPWNRV